MEVVTNVPQGARSVPENENVVSNEPFGRDRKYVVTYAFDEQLAPVVPLIPALDLTDITAARAELAALIESMPPPADTADVEIADVAAAGVTGSPDVRLRIYRPHTTSAELLPAIYDIHGGGFVLGSNAIGEIPNRQLAAEVQAVVVSVEYRLAPEEPFPAGLEDCYAGLTWLADHAAEIGVDASRIVLYGASAGGGLAAALALLARDRGGPAIAFQALSYPQLDDRLGTSSMREYIDTPMWTRPLAELSWNAYLGAGVPGGSDVSHYAAPARATDLAGLPPAYISVMHFDPLRDEGIAYAQALLAAGNTVELHLFPGTFHGSAIVQSAEVSLREAAERSEVILRAIQSRPPVNG